MKGQVPFSALFGDRIGDRQQLAHGGDQSDLLSLAGLNEPLSLCQRSVMALDVVGDVSIAVAEFTLEKVNDTLDAGLAGSMDQSPALTLADHLNKLSAT